MATKVTPIEIKQDATNYRTRFFLEVQIGTQWHDIGNFETEMEASECLSRVFITDKSWGLK